MTVDFLSITICIVSLGITLFALKIFFNIQSLKKKGVEVLELLRLQIDREQKRYSLQRGKLKLADSLHQSLFKRLFIITRQILLLSRLILDEKKN